MSCKIRPRTDEEKAAAILKEALNVNTGPKDTVVDSVNDDGFVTVGKRNKPAVKKFVHYQVPPQVKKGFSMQYRSGFNSGSQSASGSYKFKGKQGNSFWQAGNGAKKQGNGDSKEKSKQQSDMAKKNVVENIENGIYPLKEIRADWSARQMKYFYDNC
ncbi:hypothetical protein Tco_1387813, partial [Tanacetum coccineum]